MWYNKKMRIISGKFKGKQLLENKFDHIRPTTDKVKQAIFTKFQFDIASSRVLDLFCGTGALGIEAISRGASEVIFVDLNEKSVMLTKKNLESIKSNAKVYKCDAEKAVELVKGKFDFILLDPPYQSGLYEKILKKIAEYDILRDDGVIICEHAKENSFDWAPFSVSDEKNYGTITVTYLEKWGLLIYKWSSKNWWPFFIIFNTLS